MHLEKGDFVIFPKVKSQILGEQNKLTDEQIEFLGFYTAEGSIHFHKKLKQYIVSLTFNEKEQEYIQKVRDLIFSITKKTANIFQEHCILRANVFYQLK